MASGTQDSDDAITGINVTPLVDIMLVLLIIFMVTARIIASPNALAVDLPKAAGGTELQQTVFSVTLTVDGEVPLVPDSLGVTAFRVLQEAVTNVLKHAGPTATAEVRVTYTPEAIELTVRDDGMGALSSPDGHGSGLPGMRERVTAMGGEFHAGARPGGGYEVRVRLPMPSRLGKSWLRGS